ncbi:unnamed protein product, partial [Iphiclides podalirius]
MPTDPCKKLACEIQKCLSENNYQEAAQELDEVIMDSQRRSLPLGKRSWIYRYPRTFQIVFTTLGIGVFFSKPLYDLFYRPRADFDLTEPPTSLTGGKPRSI